MVRSTGRDGILTKRRHTYFVSMYKFGECTVVTYNISTLTKEGAMGYRTYLQTIQGEKKKTYVLGAFQTSPTRLPG